MTDPVIVRDFLGFDMTEVAKHGDQILDQMQKTGSGLRTTLLATSSGKLINRRVYPGKYMPETVKLWCDKEHGGTADYCKPVLLNHNQDGFGSNGDPIGRCRKAEYVQTRSGRGWELDYKRPDDENGKGSGHQILTVDITDPDAIKKILDERFLTVSMGGRIDSIRCSICQNDWYGGDCCDHRPGRKYEKEDSAGDEQTYLCYLYTGPVYYDEISFVNVPADVKARILTFETFQDSIEDNSGFIFDDHRIAGHAELQFINDSVQSLVLGTAKDGNTDMSKKVEEPKVRIEMPGIKPGELDDDADDSAQTTDPEPTSSTGEPAADPAPAVSDSTEELKEVSTDPVLTAEEFALALTARSLKESGQYLDGDSKEPSERFYDGLVQGVTLNGNDHTHLAVMEVLEDGTLVGRTYATVGEGVDDHEHVIEASFIADESQKATGTTRSAIPLPGKYSAGEDHSHTFEIAPVSDLISREALDGLVEKLGTLIESNKLSDEEQKRLNATIFCGPNHSFPVSDASLVPAARSLMAYAKFNPDQRARIRASVEKKAKQYGCEPFLSDRKEMEAPAPAPVADVTETPVPVVSDAIPRLLIEKTEEAVRLSIELDQVRTDLAEKSGRVTTLTDALAAEMKSRADTVARCVVALRIASGKASARVAKDEALIKGLIEEYAGRSPDSLLDTMNDLLRESSFGVVAKAQNILGETPRTESKTAKSVELTNGKSGRMSDASELRGADALEQDLSDE